MMLPMVWIGVALALILILAAGWNAFRRGRVDDSECRQLRAAYDKSLADLRQSPSDPEKRLEVERLGTELRLRARKMSRWRGRDFLNR